MKSNTSETKVDDVTVPSLKALEAAAIKQLRAMLKDSKSQPSEEAIRISARLMAHRAHKELLPRQAASDDVRPKS